MLNRESTCVCPYCGHETDVQHSQSIPSADNRSEYDCANPKCKRVVHFQRSKCNTMLHPIHSHDYRYRVQCPYCYIAFSVFTSNQPLATHEWFRVKCPKCANEFRFKNDDAKKTMTTESLWTGNRNRATDQC